MRRFACEHCGSVIRFDASTLPGLLLAARLRAGRTHDPPAAPGRRRRQLPGRRHGDAAVALPQRVVGMQLDAAGRGGCDLVPVVPLDPRAARRRPTRRDRRVGRSPKRASGASCTSSTACGCPSTRRRPRTPDASRVRPRAPARRARARPATSTASSRSTWPRPTPSTATHCAGSSASRSARCSAASATRSATTTGVISSSRPAASTRSVPCSVTNAPTTARRCSATTPATDGPWDEERFVTAYARSHPHEDWAETFAHYLHIVDLVDTAADHGLLDVGPPPDDALPVPAGASLPDILRPLAPHRRCRRRPRRHGRLAAPVPGPARRRRRRQARPRPRLRHRRPTRSTNEMRTTWPTSRHASTSRRRPARP